MKVATSPLGGLARLAGSERGAIVSVVETWAETADHGRRMVSQGSSGSAEAEGDKVTRNRGTATSLATWVANANYFASRHRLGMETA